MIAPTSWLSQDSFWSFATQCWADLKVEVGAHNISDLALTAAKKYLKERIEMNGQ